MTLTPQDIERIDWSRVGLLPAIVQDAGTGAVLMLAYMNRESLMATLERGRAVFFSRSRQELWEKGATSGNTLAVVDLRLDCDADTLLVIARPAGPTCHKGTRTCFGDAPASAAESVGFLAGLEQIIAARATEAPESSYTARLLARGTRRVAQKVGEEAVEVALAAAVESDAALIGESADLLYHLLVLLRSRGIGLDAVVGELSARHASRQTQ